MNHNLMLRVEFKQYDGRVGLNIIVDYISDEAEKPYSKNILFDFMNSDLSDSIHRVYTTQKEAIDCAKETIEDARVLLRSWDNKVVPKDYIVEL